MLERYRATALLSPLLSAIDSPAFTWHLAEKGASQSPIFIICDHASYAVPTTLSRLGLNEAALNDHIGWDFAAAELARGIADALQSPLVFSGYSRLVIDCNRYLSDPTLIPEISDHVKIPGNHQLSRERCEQRIQEVFLPYHRAIHRKCQELRHIYQNPVLISVHTFAPTLSSGGGRRPWEIGVLWNKDDRLASPLIRALNDWGGIRVGDNQPYSGRHPSNFSVRYHAERYRTPHIMIEVRNDLLCHADDLAHWIKLLSESFVYILEPYLQQERRELETEIEASV